MNNKTIGSMAILAEPMRIRILLLIAASGELRAKDILENISVTQPTLSHHMSLLIEGNLVIARKDGRCIWYSVNKKSIDEIRSVLNEIEGPQKPVPEKKDQADINEQLPSEDKKDRKDKAKKKKGDKKKDKKKKK